MTSTRSSASRAAPTLLVALMIAGGTLAVARFAPELKPRMWGVILGAIVVFYANAVPKALTPLARLRCDPAAEQAIRRFVGWSMVAGGLGYAAAWVVAPLAVAEVVSTALLAVAMLLAIGRCFWGRARRARA